MVVQVHHKVLLMEWEVASSSYCYQVSAIHFKKAFSCFARWYSMHPSYQRISEKCNGLGAWGKGLVIFTL